MLSLTLAYPRHLVQSRLRDATNGKPITPFYGPEGGTYVHHGHDLKRLSVGLYARRRRQETYESP